MNNGSKDFGRITSPEGDRVIATPEARATYERDRDELLKGVSTVNSGSDDNMYTLSAPGILDTSIRDLTKEAARIQDEVIQEALTARGWISPDDRKAHDDEVAARAWDEALRAQIKWDQDRRYYSEEELTNPYRKGAAA